MLYLCRDEADSAPYVLYWMTGNKKPTFGNPGGEKIWWHRDEDPLAIIDAAAWHRGGYPKLDPGGGPLKMPGINLCKALGLKNDT